MIRISQEADYAIRIVGYLSVLGQDQKCDAKTIATSLMVPQRFTVKILRKLNLSGITRAYRGALGGYTINKEPEEISFLEVVECIDGRICVNRCIKDMKNCSDNRTLCYGHDTFRELNDAIRNVLDSRKFNTYTSKNAKSNESELISEI